MILTILLGAMVIWLLFLTVDSHMNMKARWAMRRQIATHQELLDAQYGEIIGLGDDMKIVEEDLTSFRQRISDMEAGNQ